MGTVTNTYTSTFTPSLAGTVARNGVNQTFTAIQSGAGTVVSSSFLFASLIASTTTNQYSELDRSIVLFDTSSIPASATITSATLSVQGNNTGNALGSTNINIVSSNPASNSALATGDYSTLGTTSFGSIAFASFNMTGNNTFTLNSSGISNITLAGISKFGFSLEWDRANSFTGTWASSQITNYTMVTSSPVLTVTYTQTFPTLSINNISSLSNVTTITTS